MKSKILVPILTFAFVILVWEILVRANIIASYLLPPPTQILESFQTDFDELYREFSLTFVGAFGGLFLSTVLGIAIGILLSTSKMIEYAFFPYAVFFQTVPIVAIAPLLIIWFGYGLPSVIACSFIISIFPIIVNTLTGILRTPPELLDLFKLYGANKMQSLFKLEVPSATPYILSGLRIAAGLSVIGAIVGEFLGGGGLGSIVEVSRRQQRIDKMFAAILLASLLGLVAVLLIDLISAYILKKWKGQKGTL
jgi:NitT/TauT family transport system permease protein